MKLNEFKAWFEGYTESMEGTPSKKQWERIKEQVAAVDGVAITPTSYPVYIDRYVRPYWHPTYWATTSGVGHGVTNNVALLSGQAQNAADYMSVINSAGQNGDGGTVFDSATAMYAAGKAEAAAN
ncbi:hypothetical protein [Mesorhizobium sp. B263B2A]|uniref:hypothetical protein n=1 Tax=Mesorhizobium sp. B263B2A TaxID=2876669 RepID=UPI001CD0F565|nr:hypothetical protein [Mesorhizobium sp. B263B2A]MCA0032723.1 hypothetical protein [Mesorhizobium sp. B263B2A]